MAFLIQQVDGGRVPGIEYLPCGAITPRIGMALIQSGGNLAVASGTTAPTYVSMIEKETPCTVGDIIPVMRVLPDMMFETTFQAAASSVKLGDKVMRLPETFTDSGEDKRSLRRPVVGRVVYIHPKGRYHTVEFELNGGNVRESFQGVSD